MYGGAAAPTGWLLCDGTATTGYTALADIVGATTPDMRGKFPIGDNATLTLLGTGGSLKVVEANLPSHTHTFSATSGAMSANATLIHTITDPGHTHGMQDMGGNPSDNSGVNGYVLTGATQDSQGGFRSINTATTNIAIADHSVAHTHTVSGTTGTGSGTGTDYYPPYLVVNYIIKHD